MSEDKDRLIERVALFRHSLIARLRPTRKISNYRSATIRCHSDSPIQPTLPSGLPRRSPASPSRWASHALPHIYHI